MRPVRCAGLETVTTRASEPRPQPAQEEAGEGEVAEVVGADLQLEAVGGLAPRRGHHAGVVDQQVEAGRRERLGEGAHRGQVGKVELRHVRRRAGGRRRGSTSAAASPFSVLRHASVTAAPARASSRAAIRPMPLLAPVTTAVRPLWSGMWLACQPLTSATVDEAN